MIILKAPDMQSTYHLQLLTLQKIRGQKQRRKSELFIKLPINFISTSISRKFSWFAPSGGTRKLYKVLKIYCHAKIMSLPWTGSLKVCPPFCCLQKYPEPPPTVAVTPGSRPDHIRYHFSRLLWKLKGFLRIPRIILIKYWLSYGGGENLISRASLGNNLSDSKIESRAECVLEEGLEQCNAKLCSSE